MSLSEATQGSNTSATEWFTINGVLGGDDLGQFVSPLQVKTWRQMSTFAEREGFHGFQNTSRVLQCWLYYGATVNGWGSGLDHARWERFATESPPRNNSINYSSNSSRAWPDVLGAST
ncbi:hypothetical protein N7455_008600 [Penicillium solitum]|uniref:uncharacterized protein n=1 Tax=Penicillium solitum TaxID=60172 RepID=UPI0032C4B0C0|nr:hypothetical protein N7536_011448 [Penicillium majusculum]KAJ5857706.1 hypothetical protein N7455_008600 [Penicillium solitum]